MIEEKQVEMMSTKELSSAMIEEDCGFIHGSGSGIINDTRPSEFDGA